MVKLTFKWTEKSEEAKPRKKDIEALMAQSLILQLDFLQDVMVEANALYERALIELHRDFEASRKRQSKKSSDED